MTRTELLPQIFKLSPPDQLMIVEAIRNHLVGGLAPADEAEFKAELTRCQAEADADPSSITPLTRVMERLRSRR
jgi:putative addiction module component (TIGR02574 family)